MLGGEGRLDGSASSSEGNSRLGIGVRRPAGAAPLAGAQGLTATAYTMHAVWDIARDGKQGY